MWLAIFFIVMLGAMPARAYQISDVVVPAGSPNATIMVGGQRFCVVHDVGTHHRYIPAAAWFAKKHHIDVIVFVGPDGECLRIVNSNAAIKKW